MLPLHPPAGWLADGAVAGSSELMLFSGNTRSVPSGLRLGNVFMSALQTSHVLHVALVVSSLPHHLSWQGRLSAPSFVPLGISRRTPRKSPVF